MSDGSIPLEELEVYQRVRIVGERRAAIVVSIHYQGGERARVGVRWEDIGVAEGAKTWPVHRFVSVTELRRP